MSTNSSYIRSKIKNALAAFPHLPRALALVWAAARKWTAVWLILLIVQGLLPIASVYLTRALVNSLVALIESGGDRETLLPALFLLLLMALILLLTELLRGITAYVRTAQADLVNDHISQLVHDQSIAVDLAFYDSPDYFDHLHRARYEAGYRPLSLLENMGSVLQNSITLLAMALVLIPYGWWLPLALFLSSLPAFFVVLRHRIRLYHWDIATTATRRRAWYFDWLLTARETAVEIRLFNLGDHFQTIYQTLRQSLRGQRLTLMRDQNLAELGAGLSGLLVTGLAMAWMIWQAMQGLVTLGDLALVYQAFSQGQKLARSLLENLGEIYTNSLFLGDLFQFLDMQPQINDPEQPQTVPPALQVGIRFEQVSFCYPDSQRAVLEKFDLTIPAGKITAIVGVNGAGKSTLIKLLCRLYDPLHGRILLDGTDLRAFSLLDYRQRITALFQEPVHYSNTAAENITFGDLPREPAFEEIEAAAAAAGADAPIGRLPQGYETLLGKWFKGGADLSVGEWQRLALARAYLRQAPIIVLDEPTSAMDPWAETDWLQRFRSLATGSTCLIITHRFTTAMYADEIHVMEAGQIVESGSHGELLGGNGRYAQSWQAQMRTKTTQYPL